MDDQARELQTLRLEVTRLNAALGEDGFRLRRLAELGAAQAKLNHDLRNIMASALMLADRLSSGDDAKVSRSGKLIVAALEQASSLIATTFDFATERSPSLSCTRLPLAAAVDDAAQELAPHHPGFTVENAVPPALEIDADPALLRRALGHLMRTAAKAQAKHMAVTAETHGDGVHVILRDNGRPFRDQSIADPLGAFSGAYRYGSSGLGLVIARELIEAHGGSMALKPESGAESTVMELILPPRAPG
jgi:signal transduction histidine kinase